MSSVTSAPASSGVHAHRVIFIDLARALAVVFMLYGHTLDALLAPAYRTGTWYTAWQFQRGLTSSLFLTLSGFAFSIATSRRWNAQLQLSPALIRRLRRFGSFVLLGYVLHFPVGSVRRLGLIGPDSWRLFLAVDVLQLIGVTFLGVQLLVLLTRTRKAFTIASLLTAAAVVLATPWLWSLPWADVFPPAVAAYFSQALGSQFPVFPWSAFVLLGAGLGQVYGHWGAARLRQFADRVLLLPGIIMSAAVLLQRHYQVALFGHGPAAFVPPEVFLRAGVCLIGLGVIARASERITALPHLFGAVAQETLLIYFVHLCIVYGSAWNIGLAQIFGPTLPPLAVFAAVLMVIGSMVGLASYWNWFKHLRPVAARRTAVAVVTILALALV